jgi:hypothetical protein
MNNSNPLGLILLGAFIASGLASAGYFVGQTMYNAKVALNTAEAKGLAERRVTADRANWSIRFSNSGKKRDEVPMLYKLSEQHQRDIVAVLKDIGFADNEIQPGILNYSYQEFRDENQNLVDQSHRLSGNISLETDKVRLIDEARTKVNRLIVQGINIENDAPIYSFTKLNEIKPDMLKEATTNARLAANEFAQNAGVRVGGIRNATQGNFFIRDAGEEYGDTNKIEKDVRVVTTITFVLTE